MILIMIILIIIILIIIIITDIRNVICAATVIVGERLGVKAKEKKVKQALWLKRRIEGDIKILRKDLSRIEAWNKGKL